MKKLFTLGQALTQMFKIIEMQEEQINENAKLTPEQEEAGVQSVRRLLVLEPMSTDGTSIPEGRRISKVFFGLKNDEGKYLAGQDQIVMEYCAKFGDSMIDRTMRMDTCHMVLGVPHYVIRQDDKGVYHRRKQTNDPSKDMVISERTLVRRTGDNIGWDKLADAYIRGIYREGTHGGGFQEACGIDPSGNVYRLSDGKGTGVVVKDNEPDDDMPTVN